MAIVINGSGTVTGLAVGGLPDGTVDAGTLATDSVVTGKIADGTIANVDINASAAITGSKIVLASGTGIGNTSVDTGGSITASYEAGNVDTAPGGVFYKFFSPANGVATTFFTTPGDGEWCGVIEVHAINITDVNRSGYLLARFSYNETFTSMVANSQNLTIALSMSGNNMQVTCSGGSGVYRTQIRVMGSEEA